MYVFPAEVTQDWTEYLRTWDLSVTSERITGQAWDPDIATHDTRRPSTTFAEVAA